MTTTPRIFRNCTLALPLVVLGAGMVGGGRAAAEVAVGGAFGLVNLIAAAWIGTQFVREAATGEGGLYGGLMVGKMFAAVPLFVLLLMLVSPLHVVVGIAGVLAGIAITGVELAFVDPGSEIELVPSPSAPETPFAGVDPRVVES